MLAGALLHSPSPEAALLRLLPHWLLLLAGGGSGGVAASAGGHQARCLGPRQRLQEAA
jgi:hypothetical protein